MSFTSLNFLFFFPIACVLNYLVPRQWRWSYLLVVSFAFYINWQPIYALLLVAVIAITYLVGIKIGDSNKQKRWLTIGILMPLLSLFAFKYYNFINESVFCLLGAIGLRMKLPEMKALMPIGISFYTFMAISYMADVYKGKIKAEQNPLMLALFLSFFPQVSSGPIGRAGQLIPRFRAPELLTRDSLLGGVKMLIWGYFMKLCIADRWGLYVDTVFSNITNHNGTTYLLTSILYTFQIYCDFAGYSLIAIGAAKIMGIRLMDNFRRPYFAKSIKDFWDRWHISLSTWLKDYVYIPLGGNRVLPARHLLNLLLTFLVSGLWHGAAWTFVVWGGIHGLMQIIYTLWKKVVKINIPALVSIPITFICVNFAWIFFRAPDLKTAISIIHGIFISHGKPFMDISVSYGAIAFGLFILKDFHDEYNWKICIIDSNNIWLNHFFLAVLIIFILLFGVFDGGQFIYFQF